MKMKHIGWGMILILLLSVAIKFAPMSVEVTKSSYDTYDEIKSVPNIFESGWIPHWLPKTARKIQESHDIDTNEAWIAFEFLSSDNFYANCELIKRSDVVLPSEKRAHKFPDFVVSAIREIKSSSMYIYRCDGDSNRFLAVDQINSHAYIWRSSLKE